MAVPEQIPYLEYAANGVVTSFAVTFQCNSKNKLRVFINGIEQSPVYWQLSSGNVVFNTPPIDGSVVSIERVTPLKRDITYSSYDNSFRPETVNSDFDVLWHSAQELELKNKNTDQKFQDLLDSIAAGEIAGLPAEILARIAADERLQENIHIEELRAYAAEQNISLSMDVEKVRVNSELANRYTKQESYNRTEVDTTFAAYVGGRKAYTTLAAAQADQSNLSANTVVEVTNDPTTSNNGTYQWNGTTLTKSAYDPLTQAKNFTSEKAVIDELNDTDIAKLVDADGRPVLAIKKDGKVFLVGLNNDLSSVINSIDVTDLISESSSTNILELKDANGVVSLKINTDGDLFIPKIGNLTEEVIRSKSLSQGGSLQAEHLAAKYADYALSQTQEYFETDQTLLTQADVAPYFSHSVYQVRIPAITRIAENRYLLCFEARESHDDFGLISLGSAILTVDLATKVVSTSNIQVLHEAFIDEQSKLRTFMNACTVKLPTGKIICLYARRYGTTEHQLYMRTSLDDGVTWSSHTDISAIKNAAGLNLLCPCSQGLVKRYGKNKGRIVFPAWTTGAAYNASDYRSGYIYSDDDGATWNIGGFISTPSSNEVQCAEDLNGDLLFACRVELSVPYKIIVRLKEVDNSWDYITPNISFNDTPIMSGLIQGDNIYDDSANKFMMSTCKNTDRTELLIHTSYDGGYTWRSHLLQATIGQYVSYTCIENITPEFKLLIRENSMGGINASVINLKNLIA